MELILSLSQVLRLKHMRMILVSASGFMPQEDSDLREVSLNMKMHKAIAIIQFKLEGQVIKRRPEFNMDKRLLLDKIDYEEGTIMIEGKKYELLDKSFPTIDPE